MGQHWCFGDYLFETEMRDAPVAIHRVCLSLLVAVGALRSGP